MYDSRCKLEGYINELDKRCGVVAQPDANKMSGRASSEPRSIATRSAKREGWPPSDVFVVQLKSRSISNIEVVMKFVDTHTHVYLDHFNDDRQEMIDRALEQGVDKLYMPNIDSSTTDAMLKLELDYPEHCIAMMGLHPCSVKADFEKELQHVESMWQQRNFVAMGEIGIDLHWDTTFKEQQIEAFTIQTNWAKERGRPIIIHARKSLDLLIDLVQELHDDNLTAIFHCFSGTEVQAQAILELENVYLGIGGVVTFKNGGLDKIMHAIPLDRIVLETDAPYLTPKPYRGKRNEPAYIPLIAARLAELYDCTLERISESTNRNAEQIFMKNRQM